MGCSSSPEEIIENPTAYPKTVIPQQNEPLKKDETTPNQNLEKEIKL